MFLLPQWSKCYNNDVYPCLKVPTIILPAPPQGTVGAFGTKCQTAFGTFDKTLNFAPVILHGPVMNSEKVTVYCYYSQYIYRGLLFF